MSASVGGCLSALYYIFLLLSREKMVQNFMGEEGGVLGGFAVPAQIGSWDWNNPLQFFSEYAKMGMSHRNIPICL
jgi:hypothetical protein